MLITDFNLTYTSITLMAAILSAGCSQGSKFPTAPTRGIVTIDGEPLANANVLFTSPHGKSARGTTDAEGKFELSTYSENDGAVVGQHLVSIVASEPGRTNVPGVPLGEVPGRALIPAEYGNTATSGLSFEVLPDTQNDFQIELTSR